MIDLNDAVLIFDEAHNIEDVCRWAWPPGTDSSPLWCCTACLPAISLWGRLGQNSVHNPLMPAATLALTSSDLVLCNALASYQPLGGLRQPPGIAAHDVSSHAGYQHLKVPGQVHMPYLTACKERLLLQAGFAMCAVRDQAKKSLP